jgi:hypothetical protein
MSKLIQNQFKPSSQFTAEQRSFKKLSSQVDLLQKEVEKMSSKLDEWLSHYHNEVIPLEKGYASNLTELIKVLYSFYQKPKGLKKGDKRVLKELLLQRLELLFTFVSMMNVDEEISLIHEDLHGVSCKEIASEEFEGFKEEMIETLKEKGIDFDFSDVEMSDNPEEVFARMFASFDKETFQKFHQGSEFASRKKTKKELEREKHEQELESLQSTCSKKIYKQLVKILHPDLELDPILKQEKEIVMKELVAAYENQDLFSLLSLEKKWGGDELSDERSYEDEELKVYNKILRSQIKELRAKQDQLVLHPKYENLKQFIPSLKMKGVGFFISAASNWKKESQALKIQIDTLKSKKGKEALGIMIDAYLDSVQEEDSESRLQEEFNQMIEEAFGFNKKGR